MNQRANRAEKTGSRRIHAHYTQAHVWKNEYAQVILNLLTNAKDPFLKNAPVVVIASNVMKGRSVVTIRDNAGGIPAELVSRFLNRIFTTKGAQGTGIGLFM